MSDFLMFGPIAIGLMMSDFIHERISDDNAARN